MVERAFRIPSRIHLFVFAIGWPLVASSNAGAVTATVTSSAAPIVQVRVGEHAGFNRMVFDWTWRVPYRIETQEGQVTVIFERQARLDMSRFPHCPPPFFKSVKTRTGSNGLTVDLEIPSGTKLRHFVHGAKVVIDVLAPGTREDAPAS